ncbi:MAG: hypothetical protein GY820_38725 [Gammaproteobacteria bacterium]|nr:hypothetical protein [Gammaproteobacteria bacterium]
MRYDYRCASGHRQETSFPIGDMPQVVPCSAPGCGLQAKKQFTASHGFSINWLSHDVRAYRAANPNNNPDAPSTDEL